MTTKNLNGSCLPRQNWMKRGLLRVAIAGFCSVLSLPAMANIMICTGPVRHTMDLAPHSVRNQATKLGEWTCSNGQTGTLKVISSGWHLVSYSPLMSFTNGNQHEAYYPYAVFSGRRK